MTNKTRPEGNGEVTGHFNRWAATLFAGAFVCALPQAAAAQQAQGGEATAAAPAMAASETASEPAPAPEPVAAPEVAAQPEPAPAPEAVPVEQPAAPAKKPPYSLPWQLRPVVAGTAIRSDTAIALYKSPAGDSGTTIASMLLGSYKVSDSFAPLIRLGVVSNSPPAGSGSTAVTNPVIGGTYALKFDDVKLGLFLGVAFPLGGGGGNSPDLATRTAMLGAGIPARSAMDNAMFAMNYLTFFPGVGVAYVKDGLTLQAEVTLLELIRTRGEKLDTDSTRTNFTGGIHAGYFFIPELSAGIELRHQRWLSTPQMVKANADARDTTTFAVGPRGHFKLSDSVAIHPGVAFAMPIDKPLSDAKYKIFQIDIPVTF